MMTWTMNGAPVVRLEDLAPGMRLAGDVRDGRGRLLAGPATPVTPALHRRMRLWGVRLVTVQPDAGPGRRPATPATREPLAFTADDADPFMRELARQVAARRQVGGWQ